MHLSRKDGSVISQGFRNSGLLLAFVAALSTSSASAFAQSGGPKVIDKLTREIRAEIVAGGKPRLSGAQIRKSCELLDRVANLVRKGGNRTQVWSVEQKLRAEISPSFAKKDPPSRIYSRLNQLRNIAPAAVHFRSEFLDSKEAAPEHSTFKCIIRAPLPGERGRSNKDYSAVFFGYGLTRIEANIAATRACNADPSIAVKDRVLCQNCDEEETGYYQAEPGEAFRSTGRY